MENQRLIHDTAMAMATALLEMVAGCIREETHNEAFDALYVACKAGIENFCIQQERIRQRLKPFNN